MNIKNWIACVQDRGKWKEFVEKAKTFNWEVQRLEGGGAGGDITTLSPDLTPYEQQTCTRLGTCCFAELCCTVKYLY